MIKKTRDYKMFKFRADNRENGVNQTHVNALKSSIQAKNLLEFRPIIVNEEFEVMDGQHRLKAAEQLGLEVYYQQDKNLSSSDIVLMNINKAWGLGDFLNYYVKNHSPEYVKLDSFIKQHRIQVKIALNITMGARKESMQSFKRGEYKFEGEKFGERIEWCWDTVNLIKKINGSQSSQYTETSRFWKPLIKLMREESFDNEKWRENVKKLSNKFYPRANEQGYTQLIMDVYNWHNKNKIDISNQEELTNRIKDV
jgi:hypothetical protein